MFNQTIQTQPAYEREYEVKREVKLEAGFACEMDDCDQEAAYAVECGDVEYSHGSVYRLCSEHRENALDTYLEQKAA
jgi:hypothetical protein